jgi:nucleoside-diphosphate-sugar epimerase
LTDPTRAIVSGAGGFLGRALVARLEARGATVLAPPRCDLDWRDAGAVARFVANAQAVTIYHLASSGVSNAAADDPQIGEDERAMARAIAAAAAPGMRVVYAGSMAEYGRAGRLAEAGEVSPHNGYARAKVEAGAILRQQAQARGFALVHARLFGLYGPGEHSGRLLPAILAALRERRPIALSDGTQRRDFVHIDDAARALAALGTLADGPEIVNVGTGIALDVRSVALALAQELGADPALLRFGERARSPHDQDVLEADTALLAATLDWVPPQRLASAGAVLANLGAALCPATVGGR